MQSVCIIIAFVIVFGHTAAQANLRICNKTPFELWSAFGYKNNGDWFAQGWYKSTPETCKRVWSGELTNRYYYHFTHNEVVGLKYSGNARFCVHPAKRFGPTRDARRCAKGYHRIGFSEIDVKNANNFTLKLHCDSCKNPHVEIFRGGISVYYLHAAEIQDKTLDLPVTGRFFVKASGNAVEIRYELDLSLKALQDDLRGLLAPHVRRNDDCGDVARLRRARLLPGSGGTARVKLNIDYERWYCTYAKVPVFRGLEMTMKTKRTSKTRVLETGISGTLVLHPSVVSRDRVRLRGEVTDARVRNDLARFLLDVMDVDLKRIAQRGLERNLGNGGAFETAVPPEIRSYFSIDSVEFYNRGGGELGLAADGVMRLTRPQADALCRKRLGVC